MTVTTLHVSSEAITYAAAVIFCEFADLELITYAAAVISADSQFWIRPLTPQQWSLRRQCPSQIEDDHLRRSSGRCKQAMPGCKLKTTTYAAAVVAASRRCLVAS